MIPFVQPCNAGIIRTLKAYYQKVLCLCAIECDNAGNNDVYAIDLLESMFLLQASWSAVTPETIKNCWGYRDSSVEVCCTVLMPFLLD